MQEGYGERGLALAPAEALDAVEGAKGLAHGSPVPHGSPPAHGSPLPPASPVAHGSPVPHWHAILTGWRGAGKTTWCQALVEEAQRRGWQVAGLLSPAVYERDAAPGAERTKVRIDLVDVGTGERRVLATPAAPSGDGSSGAAPSAEGAHRLRWRFDEAAVAWGNDVLARAGDADLVVIDELGPMEFTYGGGFSEGLALLDGGRFRAAVVVIRPELVDTALARWPGAVILRPPEWRGD
ncbi:MAG: hypothetical protein GXY79_02065 [Chloroflexi bacterium]|nr:hypothetical protein [Chloroflexota bacterium]